MTRITGDGQSRLSQSWDVLFKNIFVLIPIVIRIIDRAISFLRFFIAWRNRICRLVLSAAWQNIAGHTPKPSSKSSTIICGKSFAEVIFFDSTLRFVYCSAGAFDAVAATIVTGTESDRD